MNSYEAIYEELFASNLQKHSSLKAQIRKKVGRILENPYHNTEALANASSRLNLIGCRSTRVDRNFRIIFVICKNAAPSRNVNSVFARIFLTRLWSF